MRRNDIHEIPGINLLNRRIETWSISLAEHIPYQTLLPDSRALGVIKRREDLGENTCGSGFACLGILLMGREVEDEIGGDERLACFVYKDEFFVGVGIHELVVELRIEFWVHSDAFWGGFGFRGEDCAEVEEGDGFVGVVLLGALFGEGFGRDDVCGGVGGCPGGEEDMVFDIWGDEVADREVGGFDEGCDGGC